MSYIELNKSREDREWAEKLMAHMEDKLAKYDGHCGVCHKTGKVSCPYDVNRLPMGCLKDEVMKNEQSEDRT